MSIEFLALLLFIDIIVIRISFKKMKNEIRKEEV
ncbi:MAG: hypothetical protein PWR12_2097 [Eubacteriaceae bacterium]|nr:hypothetical protein [Eubacteriaceae bacterium]MDK2961866.1 hypothetical protein [Eubacteriaceae bacterium]MDN5289896.1 hypothetical protein [Anaerophaga sp.]